MKCDNATNRQMGQTEYPNNMQLRNEEENNFPNVNPIPQCVILKVIYHITIILKMILSVYVNKIGSKTHQTIQLSNI